MEEFFTACTCAEATCPPDRAQHSNEGRQRPAQLGPGQLAVDVQGAHGASVDGRSVSESATPDSDPLGTDYPGLGVGELSMSSRQQFDIDAACGK